MTRSLSRALDAQNKVWWLWLPLVSVIFLGSGLLFLMQPMVGQKVAPAWGGSPAVWLSCLMFFQGTLWLGYSWAWWLVSRTAAAVSVSLQAGLLLGGLGVCWLSDLSVNDALITGFPPLGITWFLATAVGWPAVVLATTSPLLQAWLAQEHQRPRSVYRWFAVSNLASLTALLTYPWLIQARWSLSQQWDGWRCGFTLYSLLFLGLAWRQWAKRPREQPTNAASETLVSPDRRWNWQAPVAWWLLSLGPAVLLMAVSNQIAADLSAGPLLWVWPLGLYLLTYTLAFAWPQLGASPLGWLAAASGGLAMLVGVWFNAFLPAWLLGASQLMGLFFLALLSHSYLVRQQPPTQQLTWYYWMIAVGGWSGGLLVSLLAPLIFTHYYELELGVLICWWACLAVSRPVAANPPGIRFAPLPTSARRSVARLRLLGGLLGTTLISLACLLGLNAKYPWVVRSPEQNGLLTQVRTFFGVLRVTQQTSEFGQMRTIGHGSTDHGRQLIEGPFARLPTGYYSPSSGLAAALMAVRQRRPEGLQIAVLGLGAGNLVHWTEPRDRMVFYEIDPAVARVARDYFPNLQTAAGQIEVRIADGRLGLQQDIARGSTWDLIVMDAFTGDAVPTHLLTEEAWQVYLQALAPDGVVAIHISNRYIDLEPVLHALALRFDLHAWSIEHHPWPEPSRANTACSALERVFLEQADTLAGMPGHAWRRRIMIDVDPRRSHWILAGRQPFSADGWSASSHRPLNMSAGGPIRWTDDFAPLWPILK